MAAPRKRARPGDVIEVRTPRGLAYVHYTAKHPEYGEAIRVLPGFFQVRPRDWSALLGQAGYFTFYPVGPAVSQGLVEIAAHQPVLPGREVPSTFRRYGWITPEGQVKTWLINDGTRDVVRTELSAEEQRLPLAEVWNHAFLIERLVEEWHPEQETGDPPAAECLPASEEPGTPAVEDVSGRLSHYLYFPTQEAGEAVASALRKRGFEVESRLGADDVNWLVLASHVLEAPEALPSVRAELEHLAERHSGEYDGWELATRT
jgi:hypothetical protein